MSGLRMASVSGAKRRRLRGALLASASLALLAVAPAHAAWVGAQGINSVAGPGGPGGVGGGGPEGIGEGGGGGGSGSTGGVGGNASVINSQLPVPGQGGQGGTAAGSSGNGGNGQDGLEGADGGSGGGGGGGAHGYVGNAAPPSVALGGDGGSGAGGTKGANSTYYGTVYYAGGGGSGGNGGYGASIAPGANSGPITISLSVSGGDGGDGGHGAVYVIPVIDGYDFLRGAGGSGGNGGTGLFFSANSAALVINGDVDGGAGGAPGGGSDYGETGSGGVGIVILGNNNSITITGNGSVTGGLSGDLTDQADAIDIDGTGNTLTLEAGFLINGNVTVLSGSNTLALGGTAPGSFNVGQIGNTFVNFSDYAVTGGTWTLTGTNQSALAWTISGGTMLVSQPGNLGGFGSTLALNGPGTLETDATMTIGGFSVGGTAPPQINAAAGTTLTINGAITGGNALNFTGPGTVALTGANTFSGLFDVADGTLVVGASGALSTNIGVLVEAGANLTLNVDASVASLSGEGLVNVGANTLTVGGSTSTIFGGTVSGAGALTQQGSGTLTLAHAQLDVGALNIDSGTVAITAGTTVQDGVMLSVGASGTLNMGQSVAFAGISGSGTINTSSTGVNLLTVNGAGPSTFSGAITGTGGLTQSGTGTFTLSGTNTYTGTTTVNAGTLLLSGGQAIADSGLVTVNQNGTLQLGANEAIGSLSGSGTVALGGNTLTVGANGANSAFSGDISGGQLTWGGSGVLTLTGTANLTGTGLTISAGTVQLGDGTTNGTLTGDVVNNGTLSVMAPQSNVIAGEITGTGGVSIGAGFVYLTADNNYSGVTSIASGAMLFLGEGGASGSITGDVVNNGTLVFNSSANTTFGGTISGAGVVHFESGGTTAVTGSNSYTGGTIIGGNTTVAVSADVNLGAVSGQISLLGGTLSVTAGFTSSRDVVLFQSSTLEVASGATFTLNGAVSQLPESTLTKTGAGALVLTGNNTYTGGTQINGGTVQVSADTNLGAAVGGIGLNGGTLAASASFTSARDITIGASGGTFSVLDASQVLTLSGAITGSGALSVGGPGTLALTGTSSITGATTVAAGTLALYGGALTTAGLTVENGATLAGYGTINGDVLVEAGATLKGGVTSTDNSAGSALATNNLTLASGSSTILTLGNLANAGVADVNGNLSADGTLTVTGDVVYGAGYYRAFTYTGSLTNSLALNDDDLGPAYQATIDTDVSGQVNILVTSTSPLQVWASNGTTTGGSGSWSNISTTWKQPALGTTDEAWNSQTGVFTGDAGTITIEGPQTFQKLEFVTSGYTLTADAGTPGSGLTFTGGGVLWVEGHDTTATISAPIDGTGGLQKIGAGTLILSGVNTYTGGTTISGGLVQVDADTALGAAGEGITLSGGGLSASSSFTTDRDITLETHGTLSALTGATLTVTGTISGDGGLRTEGAGTVLLTGTNTYAGDTLIAAGTLQVTGGSAIPDGSNVTVETAGTLALGSSETIASLSGGGQVNLASNVLTISGDATTLFSGTILGDGRLVLAGSSTMAVTGSNDYRGGTTIGSDAILFVGNGGTSGSIRGAVTNDGALAFYRSNDLTFDGAISGAGLVAQMGTGTLTLTGSNSYTGGTMISAGGTVQVSSNANLGADASALFLNGGTLAVTNSFATTRATQLDGGGTISVADGARLTLNGSVTGAGGLTKSGLGTLVLAADNNFTGGATITGGRLQVGDGGIHGTLSGDVSNDGVLAFNLSRDYLFSDDITGSGSLVQAGTGRLVIEGDSRGAGGTVIERGILQVGNAGTTGSITGPVTNNGALVFARTNEVTFGGAISGSGSVANAGGVLILTGTSSYTGGTAIGAGATIRVSQDANLGAASGGLFMYNGTLAVTSSFASARNVGLVGGGTVDVVDGETLTLSGTVFGSGDLTKTGRGTMVLGADSLYFGNTVITEGTLQVGNGGGAGSISGNVANAGTLRFDRSGVFGVSGNISGTGQLVQAGSGTMVYIGEGTYTGGTHISAGTLMIGDGRAVGSIRGDVDNDGTLAFNRAGAVRFDGIISGSGSVAQIGQGVLTLTGSNTYTGGTFVGSGATLAVAADANLGGVASDISLAGGTLQGTASFQTARDVALATGIFDVASGATLGVNGTVSGSGGLYKIGAGTLALSAANSYQGGTGIFGGTLAVVSDANLGAASGGLTLDGGTLAANASFASMRAVSLSDGGGAFQVAGSSTLTLGGPISGGGVFLKTGDGTLVLSGSNSYSGGLFISAGMVVGNSASIVGDVVDNGALVFDQTGTGTYVGNVTGSGTFTMSGGGTLIITGTLAQTGGTIIESGTLQAAGDGWIYGPIVNNGTLVYDVADSFTFPSNMSGSGNVVLEGGATVLYAGSAFNGPISLAGAHVILSEGVTTVSPFTVGTSSILSGIGTIGALTVGNGGTVAPGYSPGTLTVTGSVSFQAGSVYQVDVQPTTRHDLITAGGSIQIAPGSSIEVVGTRGSYANTWTFTILTAAGGINGTFSGATSNFAFLDPVLSYTTNQVDMTLVRNDIPFPNEGRTPNERAAAAGTESLGAGNPVYDAVASQLKNEAFAAFDALSGEIYASAGTVMQQQAVYVRDAVGGRLRQSFGDAAPAGLLAYGAGPETKTFGASLAPVMWMQAFGGWGNSFSNGNAATISNSIGGVIGGVDMAVNDTWRVGLYGGFSQSWFSVPDRSSSGSMDNYDLGLYAGAQFGPIALRLGGGYTWHDVSASRSVAFPGYSGSNSSDYGAGLAQVFGEVGYGVSTNGIALEPFAGLAYVHLDGGSGTEVGSTSALNFNSSGMDTLYSTLGLRAGTSFSLAGRVLSPSFTLGWQHAFGDVTPEAVMSYASGSNPFTIEGVPIAGDAAIVGAALTYEVTPQASLTVRYDGQIAATASQNAFTGQFALKF